MGRPGPGAVRGYSQQDFRVAAHAARDSEHIDRVRLGETHGTVHRLAGVSGEGSNGEELKRCLMLGVSDGASRDARRTLLSFRQ